MFFQRRFVTLLALAALLFGNFAGWVHVGSYAHDHVGHYHIGHYHIGHHHVGSCCQSVALGTDDCSSDSQTGHHDGASDCCQHDDVSLPRAHVDLLVEDLPQDAEPTPTSPCDHDSDQCNICQSFFASRDAVPLQGDLAELRLADVSTELTIVESTWVASIDLSFLSVRGPPLA